MQSGRLNRIVLSEDEDEDNNIKYVSDDDNDDDEPTIEPMSAEALQLLQTEKVLKSSYLLKKGEKRRTWKKRWFVLRTTKLAMYKDKKEYKLLRIIDLHDIHKVVQVTSKHKYKYVFAFVTAKRMYYLQANDQKEMEEWITILNQAKQDLRLYDADDDTSSINRDQEFANDVIVSYNSKTVNNNQCRRSSNNNGPYDNIISPLQHEPASTSMKPIIIPKKKNQANDHMASSKALSEYALGHSYPLSPSSDQNAQLHAIEGVISSEDDEEYSADKAKIQSEENRSKVLIEGYLLKLGRNKGWRKRWFVLRTDTLAYYENDKEYAPHRIIPLQHIIDSLEIDPISKSKQNCFKIIIPKRSYVLCAPNEANLDAWLNALVVAIRRAKKIVEDDDMDNKYIKKPGTHMPQSPVVDEAHLHNLHKTNSACSSADSFENVSHLSGVSGAGGIGGAGGALGGAPTSSNSHNSILHLHSRASERLGRAK
ncbi:MAG: hypothetical protein EXX96DRAFT_578041 [Benjaminiella poitrasii]|nr:MAG: hypothetical protein EXX96DRAFT_578041 [Benjaminiella poitrasii]